MNVGRIVALYDPGTANGNHTVVADNGSEIAELKRRVAELERIIHAYISPPRR